MTKNIFSFLKQKTTINIIINTFGNYLNIFFTAFFAFFLVRIMNPVEYGTLSVLLGIAYILANILDFGTTASIYSYLPPLLENDKKKSFIFLKTIFFYQTIFSLVVITFLFLFFPYLDKIFFKTGAPKWELYLTTFSVLFFIWQNYAINSLNAAKKFLTANIFLNLSNILKTVFIFILIPLKLISVGSVVFTFGIFGPVIFFLFLFFEKKNVFFEIIKAPVDKNEFRFRYTITFFIASQFFNLASRVDLFLLSFFFPKSPQIGYYGLAQKIILTIMASVASITQVLSPNFSKIKTKEEIFKEFRNGFLYLLIPAFLFVILYFTPNWIFYIFFTTKYAQTALITKALALPFIFYVFLNLPFLFLLYTVKKPKIILISNLVYFFTMVIGCFYIIPKSGMFGIPKIVGLGYFLALITASFFSFKEYKQLFKK